MAEPVDLTIEGLVIPGPLVQPILTALRRQYPSVVKDAVTDTEVITHACRYFIGEALAVDLTRNLEEATNAAIEQLRLNGRTEAVRIAAEARAKVKEIKRPVPKA